MPKLLAILLFARVLGWEVLGHEADATYVASVIRYRMLARDLTVEEVVLAPHQFSVAHMAYRDPPNLADVWPVAASAIDWEADDLPVKASHFWSPLYLEEAPFWAAPELEVAVPAGLEHRYYRLPDWSLGGLQRP